MDTTPLIEENKGPSKLFSYRYWCILWAMLGAINLYFQRFNLSVAMVAMVNQTYANGLADHQNDSTTCPFPSNWNETSAENDGELMWDQRIQSTLLGAFFYSYLCMQIPAGMLAERFGPKILLGLGTLGSSILTLLLPISAQYSWKLCLVCRIFQGFSQGVLFPSLSALLGQWAPPSERSVMATILYSGPNLGIVIGFPITGLLCKSDFLGGWPSVFYINGFLGLIWLIFWVIFCFDNPEKHTRISDAEKAYINSSLGKNSATKVGPTPWRSILTSAPVWALVVAHTSFNWTAYTLLTEMPSYLAKILHFNVNEDGFLSALPYLFSYFVSIASGRIADHLRDGRLSTRFVRRLFNSLGLTLELICLLGLSFVGCDRTAAVVLLIFGTGLSGLSTAGYMSNHLDLAPDYAGSLMGLTNGFGTIPGFLGPLMVGYFTEPVPTINGWRSCFYISAAICAAGTLVFLCFGAGEIQPWAVNRKPIVINDKIVNEIERGSESEEGEKCVNST